MAELLINVTTKGADKVKTLDKDISKLDKSSKNFSKTSDKLNESLTSQIITIGKYAGSLYAVSKAYDLTVKKGFEFNKSMETNLNGIRALIVATSANESSTGRMLSITEKYTLAQQESLTTVQALQKVNAETPHALDQTVQIYKALFTNAKNVGASQEQMIKMTELVSKASGAAGIEFQSLLASVDGLANGTFEIASEMGRFLSSIGLTSTKLKELSKSGESIDFIIEKLSSFDVKIGSIGEATSNLDNAWSQLMGNLTKSSFEASKGALNDLSEALGTINAALYGELRSEKDLMTDKLTSLRLESEKLLVTARQSQEVLKNFQETMFGKKRADQVAEVKNAFIAYNKTIAEMKAIQDQLTKSDKDSATAKEKLIAAGKAQREAQLAFDSISSSSESFSSDAVLKNQYERNKRNTVRALKDAEKEAQFGDNLKGLLATNISQAVQTAIDGNFNFGKFGKAIAGSIGSSFLSQGIADMMASSTTAAMDAAMARTGYGLLILAAGKLMDSVGGNETLYKSSSQITSEKIAEEMKKSAEALQKTVSILNNSSQQGTAISSTIVNRNSEIDSYKDLIAKAENNIRILNSLNLSNDILQQQEYDKIRQYNDAISNINRELKNSALSFANELLPRFESIGKISDSLKGTTDYQDALIERAKQQLPVYAREKEGFIEYADSISQTGIEINNLLSLIEANTVGTATYEDSLASLIDILDLSDNATLEYALNTVEAIELVGQSFEDVSKTILDSTKNLKNSFSSVSASMNSIIQTSQQVSDSLYGADFYSTLADAKSAQEKFLGNIYDTGLATDFQSQVSKLSGSVSSFLDVTKFSSAADYEFNKAVVAKQFDEFKSNAELAVDQVDESIQLLQNIEDAINGTEGTNQIQTDILAAIQSQASTQDILDIINAQGGKQLTVTSDGSITGYASGGFTPKGEKNTAVGNVHAGEWVAPQWMVNSNQDLFKNLDMARKKGGFANGGYVSDGGSNIPNADNIKMNQYLYIMADEIKKLNSLFRRVTNGGDAMMTELVA